MVEAAEDECASGCACHLAVGVYANSSGHLRILMARIVSSVDFCSGACNRGAPGGCNSPGGAACDELAGNGSGSPVLNVETCSGS